MGKSDPVAMSNRLTVKELNCEPKNVLKMADPKSKLILAHIYGTASRCGIQADSNKGGQTYTYFIGTFEGVNVETGEIVQSSKLYLPPGASETLEAMLNQVKDRRPTASVNFAFEIVAAKTDATDSGYTYETRTILRPEQADLLESIRDHVQEHTERTKESAKAAAAKKSAA